MSAPTPAGVSDGADASTAAPPWLQGALAALLRAPAPAALLVSGPAGVGKSALAVAYAQALLCEARAEAPAACGRCAACRWVAQGSHPDLRLIVPDAHRRGAGRGTDDDATDAAAGDAFAESPAGGGPSEAAPGRPAAASRAIRIAQIQQLADFVAVGGHRGARRVVVIDPADAMNAPAANALLKTLEEPPAGVSFLLCTARAAMLPATVRSRCRVLALAVPPPEQALAWLRAHAELTEPQAQELLAGAGGAPLAALALADAARSAARRAMLDTIAGLPDSELAEAADALADADAAELVMLLQRWLLDIGRVATGAQARFGVTRAARLAELARRSDPRARAEALARLTRQRALAGHPLNARLFVEETLHGYARAFGARRAATGYAR